MLNNGSKLKLLVVDDRAENLLALRVVLESQYELIECLSGFEALKHIKYNEFAAILLDVQMPNMDGFELARLIRKEPQCAHTPIIFITAIHRTDEYEHSGYVAGAVDFLFKPINSEILLAKLAVFAQLHQQSEQLRFQALKERENQYLRESLKARDEFLSMASHELKTPITPLTLQMQAFIEMLQEGTLEKAPKDKLLKMLTNSFAQVERLSRTVDELLDVSRFATGKFELKRDKCDLRELVEKVVGSYAEQLRHTNTSVIVEANDKIEGFWDCFRIEQVIINLLTNSMKYGEGKPITISLGTEPGHASFTVRDQGIGIAESDQLRIFNRFERAASPMHYGGLGLGLYIASQIVELHGGTIRVQSEVGKGASFTVRIPIVPKSDEQNVIAL